MLTQAGFPARLGFVFLPLAALIFWFQSMRGMPPSICHSTQKLPQKPKKQLTLPTLLGLLLLPLAGILVLTLSSEPALGDEVHPALPMDLCALQKDFFFFTGNIAPAKHGDILSCDELLRTKDALRISDKNETKAKVSFTAELKGIVAGSPAENMAPAIALFDREIAGLIVGIGKKESNWGVHTPKLSDGEECYNFWGYRGEGDRGMTPDGYGCFTTPEAAVQTIGARLITLRDKRESATPERMVVWKCGSSCATHSPESVRKWISDVNLYYLEIAHGG